MGNGKPFLISRGGLPIPTPSAGCQRGDMQRLTSPEQLEQLAGLLDREAGQLDYVLTRLRGQVAATHGSWEGRVADSFRSHTGPQHRQHHLRVARDRLREAARLARLAATETIDSAGARRRQRQRAVSIVPQTNR